MPASESESGPTAPPLRWLALGVVFTGVWLGLIGGALILEKVFNSDSMAGSGGMTPIPAFFIGGLFLGWIPALLVTYVVGVRKARRQNLPRSGR